MELKQFISTAIVDIIRGVEESRKELGNELAKCICPVMNAAYAAQKTKIEYDSTRGLYYQQIDFDIAVTAESKDNAGGKAGINVLGLTASIGTDANVTNVSVSRIKFSIPIGLNTIKGK